MRTRVNLSDYMVKLLEEASQLARVSSVNEALDRLLVAIELHARLGKLDIGIEWSTAASALKLKAETVPEQTDFPDIDHELLEHGKSRSGFVGVYFANGKFRAIVPDPAQGGGAKTLTGRTTALEAAVDRYRWYHEHGIPYGNLGWHIANHREQHPEKSVEQALLWARDLVSSGTFGLKKPFTLEQVDRTLAALRKRLGKPEEIKEPALTAPGPNTDVSGEVKCAVCGDAITEGEPLSAHPSSPSAWAHAACV